MKLDVMDIFGDGQIDIECPKCSYKIPMKFRDAYNEGAQVECPSCHSIINLKQDEDNERQFREANKALEDFEKALKFK